MRSMRSDGNTSRPGSPPGQPTSELPGRLVDAATSLFAQRGFENTSVQDVCDAVGVTKGAMYYYFKSKDELLYEIYGRMLRLQMEHLVAVADSDLPLLERVRQIFSEVVVTSIAHMHQAVIFWRSLHQLNPEMQATVRNERRRYHQRFHALLVEGVDSGQIRTDISPDVIIDFFFGSVHHLSMWFKETGPLTSEEVGDQFAELMLSGIVVHPPQRA